MADALLVAGVAAGAAAVGAVAVAATSRGRLARTRGQALAARTSLEAIERTSTEERRIRDTILSSMREGVLLVDRDGRCVFANDALVRHLGVPRLPSTSSSQPRSAAPLGALGTRARRTPSRPAPGGL